MMVDGDDVDKGARCNASTGRIEFERYFEEQRVSTLTPVPRISDVGEDCR